MLPGCAVGLGTWKCAAETTSETVYTAIQCGYRYIDCAYEYLNEREVGFGISRAIRDGLVHREELFVATKLWQTNHRPDLVWEQCLVSLRNLQLDYLDLFVIHWPLSFVHGDDLYPRVEGRIYMAYGHFLQDTWRAMEALVDKGVARHIGVSNYCVPLLLDLLAYCRVQPFSNQIEVNIFNYQNALVAFCAANSIIVTAYSPLGGSYDYGAHQKLELSANSVVYRVSAQHKCTPADIALAWHMQAHDPRFYNVVVKSQHEARLRANLNVSVKLSTDDLQHLRALDLNARKNNAGAVFWETPVFD